MSWATCYNTSNNIHFNLPPLMSDGRNYTTYKHPETINNKILRTNNIKSNDEYRRFLVNNAEKLIAVNHVKSCESVGQSKFNTLPNNITMEKYKYRSVEDRTQPYGYENSDLKNMYLSRQELENKLVSPLMSQQGHLLSMLRE